MCREVLFISGTRADFGKIKPLISTVENMRDFKSSIFVTGMHMMEKYGNTYKEVERSGFKNIYKYINQHVNEPMEMVLANTVHGLSRFIHENRPDMIVVHGDRVEALAGAIVGSMSNILVAHIEGGERSGTIDELIRHSVTKLSHVHLVANQEAKNRVAQMGELPQTIRVIGSPDIDVMKSEDLPMIEEVLSHYDIEFDDYHIVMFHPVTTEYDMFSSFSKNLVDALLESEENFIVIYPKNDYGTNKILEEYKRLEGNKHFKIFPSIKFESFLVMIKYCKSVIGNSSAGIREAPIYGVPTINVGTRQNLRYKFDTIVDVGYSKHDIVDAIKRISDYAEENHISEYFGEGNSADLFRDMLLDDEMWSIPQQKIFVDMGR
ncbi:MAG: UDP-N-acetylglucosamine 2-epimerase [Sphaerochaetaceae bacterium]|nr:UDP-N-acetylglucosamine 2-epimerase [Sphaerochaetaceae bacterium]